MRIDSRDSDTLKPPELDELGQLIDRNELDIGDDEIDGQVECFPLVVTSSSDDDDIEGFLFGSLERVGGTPCVLWGLGSAVPGRTAKKVLSAMAEELFRRAAITFPDEDVLVGGRFAQPSAYTLLDGLADRVPRPDHRPSGEERAWGRRLAKRFGCDHRYDDQVFCVSPVRKREASVDAVALNGTTPKLAGKVFDELKPPEGSAIIAFGWALAEDLAARLQA
ncbi:MAG: hypothetical protein HYU28_09440 [Actinobacteria bacterium]|nr:hypothetical protein [Actinomycetota bacterium]